MSDPVQVLRDRFGFDQFRPGQREVVDRLLAGRSAVAVFPTGGGKSLCYQLPALILSGTTLVVSPLLALMKEQIDRLQEQGARAARLDSTLTTEEAATVSSDFQAGRLQLLYVAPERFNNERFRETLGRSRIALFAVDEAHCISEWGHSFRPDYLKLARAARQCRAERILALTATATPAVAREVCQGFDIPADGVVRTGFHRPNLSVLLTPVSAAGRDAALLQRLRERPRGPTIVYVTLQHTAEVVAQLLKEAGLPARPYHAGMEADDRAATQDWFAAGDQAIVVATIAFGMGIDKANIRAVYHYNLAKSLENFSQEIGRAGRDGQASVCETFVCPDDLNTLENFAHGDLPAAASVRGLVTEVFRQGEAFDLSTYDLAQDFDIRSIVLDILLTYLELDGYLEAGTPFFAGYQFQPLAPSAEILARFEGERRDFLTKLFRTARKAKIWFHVPLDEAMAATGAPRDRIVRALDYLADQRLLEVKTSQLRHCYRRQRLPTDVEALARSLHQRLVDREARETARLRQVVELAALDGCQVSHLGAHFGEPLPKPCGHCSWCLAGRAPARLLPRPRVAIEPGVWTRATALRHEHPDPLAEPRALARFLCGLTSPRLSRNRLLMKDKLFGALARVPFPEVLRAAEAPA